MFLGGAAERAGIFKDDVIVKVFGLIRFNVYCFSLFIIFFLLSVE